MSHRTINLVCVHICRFVVGLVLVFGLLIVFEPVAAMFVVLVRVADCMVPCLPHRCGRSRTLARARSRTRIRSVIRITARTRMCVRMVLRARVRSRTRVRTRCRTHHKIRNRISMRIRIVARDHIKSMDRRLRVFARLSTH